MRRNFTLRVWQPYYGVGYSPLYIYYELLVLYMYVCYSYIPLRGWYRCYVTWDQEEPRSSVITMISFKYTGYNWLTYVPYTFEIGNYMITSYLLNKHVGDNYCSVNWERYGWTKKRFNTMSTEFAIQTALWDVAYVGRWHVPDKPKRWCGY